MSESGATVRFIGQVKQREGQISVIELFEEYCPGLLGIEEYSHLIILYWMHQVDDEGNRGNLYCYPRRDKRKEPRGVFTCRNPSRPNPIGITVVEFIELDGCKLKVKGLDAFAGSPIVDIKSY
jgi:tRNA-Thr(GGU) m(6)t(6)A37 methyltransferase TsaA